MVDAETSENSGITLDVNKMRSFEVRADDIFILTYPKSGTTWMKEVLPLVLNGGDIDAVNAVAPDLRAPYFEFVLANDSDPNMDKILRNFGVPEGFDLNTLPSPRILNSHMRTDFLPKQLSEKKPKVVYVARNPKDVAVSTFHFAQKELPAFDKKSYDSFSEFLPDFLNAKNGAQIILYDGTTWKDHVLPWWERRHEANVFFITFEEMKRDLPGSVRKLAEFLEVKLDDSAVERIASNCTFESMKKNPVATKSDYCVNVLKVDPTQASPFVRKGKVGGWKSVFTVADNDTFDEVYQEWTKESDFGAEFEL